MGDASDEGTLKRKATVAVDVVPADGGVQEGPFVLYNPSTGGIPPSGTEFRAWRKNVEYRGHHLVIRGRTDGVDYVGNNFSRTSAAPKDAVKYFVARLRRVAPGAGGGKSGGGGGSAGADDDEEPEYTLQMTPVGGGRIIDLETRCHALEYDAPAWDGAEDLNDYAVRAAHNDRLLKAFSSAKRQRKVARIQAERKIDASTLAAPDAMEATLKAATAGELDARALAALAGERRNIPAHVASATNPAAAYPLDRFPLYPLIDRTRWKDLVKASKKPGTLKELRDAGDVDPFVLDLVPRLAEPGADADRGKALGALAFLLRFREHRGVVTERAPKEADAEEGAEGGAVASAPMTLSWAHDSKVHPALQRAAIDEWMEQQTRDDAAPGDPRRFARPKAATDLVTLHVILMALRACGWTIDVSSLAKRLRVSVQDLVPHCKELGLTTKKSTGKASEGGGRTVASLPLDGVKTLGDLLPEIKRRPQAAKKRD